jgi:hypothetical protein
MCCCVWVCFALLYLLRINGCVARVAAMHGEERGRERWEVGPAIVAACELPQSARGVRARVCCGGDGGGAGARAVVGHQAKREIERGGGRAGDANTTVQDIN